MGIAFCRVELRVDRKFHWRLDQTCLLQAS